MATNALTERVWPAARWHERGKVVGCKPSCQGKDQTFTSEQRPERPERTNPVHSFMLSREAARPAREEGQSGYAGHNIR